MLLSVVCASIGLATEFALQRFLMRQLDQQLVEAGKRSAAIFDLPPPSVMFPGMVDSRPPVGPPGPPEDLETQGPPRPGYPYRDRERYRDRILDPEYGPGPGFLNAPGQATRTVGAVVSPSGAIDAGVITPDGGRSEIRPAAAATLARVPATRTPQTVDLPGLGSYRVIALHARHGDETIVTGLPTAVVDDTLLWVLGMFFALALIALLAAGIAGLLVIRRQLAPLSRVNPGMWAIMSSALAAFRAVKKLTG